MIRRESIEQKLRNGLEPEHLEVLDESHQHNVPANAESHFRVTVVTPSFEDLALLARHRSVYRLLEDDLQASIHALALHTYTPAEWAAREGTRTSPPCLGGG